MDDQVQWSGVGRWLSFVAAGLLIIIAVAAVFSHDLGAMAGWNIFLGLLLIGVIASGHRKAPLLAAVLCVLTLLRLILSLVSGSMIDAAFHLLLLGLLVAAWQSLRKQAADL